MFSSTALLMLLDRWQWHRRVPLPPPSLFPMGSLTPELKWISFLSSGDSGGTGLHRNIAEQLRNAELEPLHVLAEAARSLVPASHPTPPAWLYGSTGAGPLPSDLLPAKTGHRSCPWAAQSVLGSSLHWYTPSQGDQSWQYWAGMQSLAKCCCTARKAASTFCPGTFPGQAEDARSAFPDSHNRKSGRSKSI